MINSVLSYTECLIFSCKILLLVKYVLRCFYTKTYYCLWSRKIVWKLNQFKLIVAVQTSCSVFWLYIKNIVHFVNTRNHSSISTFFHAQAVKHQTDISDIHTVYSFLFHLQILLVNMVYLECFKHSCFLFHSYISFIFMFSLLFSLTPYDTWLLSLLLVFAVTDKPNLVSQSQNANISPHQKDTHTEDEHTGIQKDFTHVTFTKNPSLAGLVIDMSA